MKRTLFFSSFQFSDYMGIGFLERCNSCLWKSDKSHERAQQRNGHSYLIIKFYIICGRVDPRLRASCEGLLAVLSFTARILRLALSLLFSSQFQSGLYSHHAIEVLILMSPAALSWSSYHLGFSFFYPSFNIFIRIVVYVLLQTALNHFWNKILIDRYFHLCLISLVIFMPAFLQSSKLMYVLTGCARMGISQAPEN